MVLRSLVLSACLTGLAAVLLNCSAAAALELASRVTLSEDGQSIVRGDVSYYPIDDSGVFFYDPSDTIGCPLPDPGVNLRSALERNGFGGIVRCRLVDYVDCSGAGHGFRESGGSRVLRLGDDLYRVTTPAGRLGWFSYELATRPTPGKPHLVVCQLINDRERYTTVTCNQAEGTVWAAPYAGEEQFVPENQEGNTWRCDVGVAVYTGREYPCDGSAYIFATLFYPKTDRAKITISHRADEMLFDERNGAAVARIWMFEVQDSLPQAVEDPVTKFNKAERKVALYVPHPWFLYSQFGLPCRTEEQRVKSLEEMVRYMKFCGFNQLQLHAINGSDRASRAWYDSKMYPNLQGDLFKELLPIAEREGIEVVPIVTPLASTVNDKPSAVSDRPGERGWSRDSYLLDREGDDFTRAFGGPVPNPLRPEVQQWQIGLLTEMLDRCSKSPAVPAVGMRVNGKIGLCFTGEQRNKCGQDGGYNDWMVEQFTADTGIEVPRQEPTSYSYIRENCWDEWLQWRCVRMRDFWLKCRDEVRAYRPDLNLLVACDLPSETPGYNIEWPSGEHSIRDLFRHHGYDPELFRGDEGLEIQRGMMVASDRYWYESWFPYQKNAYAHKMFNYAPGVAESYETPEPSSVELYHNYWEEDPHPDPQYGDKMRTATPVAYKDYFYEPAAYSLRKVNADRIAFMGWERACAGHEHDMRRFARAYRALPVGEPGGFTGTLEVLANEPGLDEMPDGYTKPEPDVLWAAEYGDVVAVINDAVHGRKVKVSLSRPLRAGQAVIEHGSGNIAYRAAKDGPAEFVLDMRPFDLQTLSVSEPAVGGASGAAAAVTLSLANNPREVTAGGSTSFGVRLANDSAAPLKDIVVNVRLPQGWKAKSGDRRTLDSLAAGAEHVFPVNVDVDASAAGRIDSVQASVGYQSGAQSRTLRVQAVAAAVVPVSVSQETPVYATVAGESLRASVGVSNSSARAVSGELDFEFPSGWSVTTDRNVTLESGADRVVELDIAVPPTATPRRYTGAAVVRLGEMTGEPAPVVVDVALKCPRVSPEPQVDGVLSEWKDRAVLVDQRLFTLSEGASTGDLEALAPAAWLGWDDQRLYLALRVSDESFSNPFPDNEMWKGDSVQVGIDPFRLRSGPRGNFEYGFTAAQGGGARVRLFRTTRDREGASADATGFSVRGEAKVTNYEAALRWEDLGVKPAAGDVIGVSLVINNYDGTKRRAVTFGGGLVETKDPGAFVAVRLEP